jgi:hypothetical protein
MPEEEHMRMNGRRGVTVVLVLLVLVMDSAGVVRAQPSSMVPLDGRIQELSHDGVLVGTPGGDLQLDRNVQGGEFITLVERVLRTPASSAQSLSTETVDTGSTKWVRAYAWSRTQWDRALTVWTHVRQLWFDLRYRRATNLPWGLARTNWMSAGLRDAYLESRLIDLSFKPMEVMNGSDAIDLVLAAAGYRGEVAVAQDQMLGATSDEARLMVCRQHDLDRLMQYAGRPLTRKDAALMVWLLREQHMGTT